MMSRIGAAVPHVDWAAIVGGTAQYTDDVTSSDELVGAVLRSPHPHARITSLDTSRARRLPGVRAVLTAADVTSRHYLDYRPLDADRPILARDITRHIGEPVALVAADNEASAQRALAAITVRYRRLPTVDTVRKALRPKSPAIHADAAGNIAAAVRRSFGTPTGEVEHRLQARYRSTRQTHVTMEPHVVRAHWRAEEGRLHVWAPSQNPRSIHRELAHLFELELQNVRLHEVMVGGDFGGRTQISSTEALACALSLATARPVKLSQTRAEEFSYTKWRLSWDLDLDLTCDGDGRLLDLSSSFDVDNGAYNQAGPGEMEYGSIALASTYRWKSYEGDGRCVYTNKPSASSFRGAGGYAVTWAIETAVDELAERVGIDPIDFRLLNAVSEPGETSLTGWQVKSGALKECLETVRREIDWDRKRADSGKGRGVGVACSMHVTALSREYMLRSQAALDIDRAGVVTIRSGLGDAGTGQKTLLCQAVAEVLELKDEDVKIVTIDTDRTLPDAGAGASRGTYHSVNTAKKLAEEAREALLDVAAEKLHTDRAEIEWVGGEARHADEALSLGDLAGLAAPMAPTFTTETTWVGTFHDAAEDGYEDLAPTYSFAAHAVEVEVDEQTGKVSVLRAVAAHDSGRVLNPTTARGQVEGGLVMGMGAVLAESLIFEGGRVVNGSFADYVVPRSNDSPPIDTYFIESDDAAGPFGAKGLGEIPLITIGPAVTNAIAHATGVRLREAPHTPDQVLTAIRRRDRLPTRVGSVGWNPHRLWIAALRRLYPLGLHRVLQRLGPILRPSRPPTRIEKVSTADSKDQGLTLLASDPTARPMGAGTDLLAREAQGLPVPVHLVSMAGVEAMRAIRELDDGALSIGGAVTLSDLATHPTTGAALAATIEQIATHQLRSTATVAGNLCQAKRCWFYRNGFDCYKRGGATRPCYAVLGDHRFYHTVEDGHRCQAVTPSDLATTLTALDAEAVIEGGPRPRRLLVADIYSGPGEVNLRQNEVITEITVPAAARRRQTVYRKLSLWRGAFAMVTVAVSAARTDDGTLRDLRMAIGGVAPTPRRVTDFETMLEGHRVTGPRVERAAEAWLRRTQPLVENHWKAVAAAHEMSAAVHALVPKGDEA